MGAGRGEEARRGNLAGGRGGRGENLFPEKALLLSLPLSSCKGRRRKRTGGWWERYEMMLE